MINVTVIGGDPDAIRVSEKGRCRDPAIVDKVIDLDN